MLVDDLAKILAKPTDAPGLRGQSPATAAAEALSNALKRDHSGQSANFEPPIEVIELAGPLQLYRIYDWRLGDVRGDWWVEMALVREIVGVASRRSNLDAYDRQAFVLRLLRSAVCVHPGWKNYSDIARLDLAHGRTVPAITGRASPRALKMSATETERVLGQVFLPGSIQYFIPQAFIKPNLVQKVQRNSQNWPFS